MLIVMVLPQQYHWLCVLFHAFAENMFSFIPLSLFAYCLYDLFGRRCVIHPLYRSVVRPCIARPLARFVEARTSRNATVLNVERDLSTKRLRRKVSDQLVDTINIRTDPNRQSHRLITAKLEEISQEHALATGMIDARTELAKLNEELSNSKAKHDASVETVGRLEDRLCTL